MKSGWVLDGREMGSRIRPGIPMQGEVSIAVTYRRQHCKCIWWHDWLDGGGKVTLQFTSWKSHTEECLTDDCFSAMSDNLSRKSHRDSRIVKWTGWLVEVMVMLVSENKWTCKIHFRLRSRPSTSSSSIFCRLIDHSNIACECPN